MIFQKKVQTLDKLLQRLIMVLWLKAQTLGPNDFGSCVLSEKDIQKVTQPLWLT